MYFFDDFCGKSEENVYLCGQRPRCQTVPRQLMQASLHLACTDMHHNSEEYD